MKHRDKHRKRKSEQLTFHFTKTAKTILSLLLLTFSSQPLLAQQGFSTQGSDFWFGFMENRFHRYDRADDGTNVDENLTIYVTTQDPGGANFTIDFYLATSSCGVPDYQTPSFYVDSGEVYVYSIRDDLVPAASLQLEESVMNVSANDSEDPEFKAINVRAANSNNKLSVYAMNFSLKSSDATIVYPTMALGTEYVVMSYYPNEDDTNFCSHGRTSQFMVVATEDDTYIEIELQPGQATVDTNNGGTGLITKTILYDTLCRGEVLQVKSYGRANMNSPFDFNRKDGNLNEHPADGCPGNRRTSMQTYNDWHEFAPLSSGGFPTHGVFDVPGNFDLTGAEVKSKNGKPVAVFSGNFATTVPFRNTSPWGGWDHLIEQMPPTSVWGKIYYSAPLTTTLTNGSLRDVRTYYRILAKEPATVTVTEYLGGGSTNNPSAIDQNTANTTVINNLTVANDSFVEFRSQYPVKIEATSSCISVGQFSPSLQDVNNWLPSGSTNAMDPFLIMLSPIDQVLNNMAINVMPSTLTQDHYLALVGPSTASGNDVEVNGTPVTLTDFDPTINTGIGYAIITSDDAAYLASSDSDTLSHQIDATEGVITYVFGYGEYESYGYTAGASAKPKAYLYALEGEDVCFGNDIHLDILDENDSSLASDTGLVVTWELVEGSGCFGTPPPCDTTSNQINPVFTPTSPGTVTFQATIIDTAGNICFLADTVVLQIDVDVNYVSIYAGEDRIVCWDGNCNYGLAPAGYSNVLSTTWSSTDPTANDAITNNFISLGAILDVCTLDLGTPYTFNVHAISPDGCSADDEVTLIFNESVVVELPEDTASFCFGDTVNSVIPTSVSYGTPPYSYLWDDGSTLDSLPIQITEPGIYSYGVTVTDSLECSDSDTLIIIAQESPSIDAGADFTVCWDSSETVVLTPSSYPSGITDATWVVVEPSGTSIDNFTDSLSADFHHYNISPCTTATFEVKVFNENGCEGVSEVTVNFMETPEVSVEFTDPDCDMNNGSITFIEHGSCNPYLYDWSGVPVSGNTAGGLAPGTYDIQISDTTGTCTIPYTVVLEDSCSNCPPIDTSFTYVNIGGSTVTFTNTTDILGADPDFATWDFGDGSDPFSVPYDHSTGTTPDVNHTYSEPGIYVVCLTIIDILPTNQCCSTQICDTILIPEPSICDEFTANIDFSYDWSDPTTITFEDVSVGSDVSIWTITDGADVYTYNGSPITHTFSHHGFVSICLTAVDHIDEENNVCCIDDDCDTLYVCPDTAYVPEDPEGFLPLEAMIAKGQVLGLHGDVQIGDNHPDLQVYPNPTSGNLTVSLSLKNRDVVTILVTNLVGERVKTMVTEKSLDARKHLFTTNMSNLSSGIYLVRCITLDGSVITKKVSKF